MAVSTTDCGLPAETRVVSYDQRMRAYVLAVGSELLGADRSDTNSLWLAAKLAPLGVGLVGKAVVGDDAQAIEESLRFAMQQADLVVVTGGLGPTSDDLTREVVAHTLHLELQHNAEVAAAIEGRFSAMGIEMAQVNMRQAMVPQGARVLENSRGTAPGLWIETDGVAVVLLPGVPGEMKGLAHSDLLPWVASQTKTVSSRVHLFRVACLPESTVEQALQGLYEVVERDQVTILARPGDIRVEIRESSDSTSRVDLALIKGFLGDAVYSQDAPLEQVVIEACIKRGMSLAAAESCSGGELCSRLTGVAGASAAFVGGIVAYDNRIKQSLVDVSQRSLEQHGAVSEEVAVELAEGVRDRFGSDIGVAITGVAGPSGGTETKPVGTVWFAWSLPGVVESSRIRFPGSRNQVRAFATQWALDGVRRRLSRI